MDTLVVSRVGQVGLRQGAPKYSAAWWIEKITHSHTHHTVVIIDDVWCISAQPGGVAKVRIDSYPALVYTEFQYFEDQAAKVAAAAVAMVGQEYNYVALFVIAASFLTGLKTPERIAAFVSNNHRLDCSQLCDMALLEGTGVRLFPNEAGLIYPGQFERFTADVVKV